MNKTYEKWVKSLQSKRSLSEILIDADNANDYITIKKLSDEFIANKESFAQHEYLYGLEHLRDIADRITNEFRLKQMLDE